jgi:hypothetical protein
MRIWKQIKLENNNIPYLFGKTIIFLRLGTHDAIETTYTMAIEKKHKAARRI